MINVFKIEKKKIKGTIWSHVDEQNTYSAVLELNLLINSLGEEGMKAWFVLLAVMSNLRVCLTVSYVSFQMYPVFVQTHAFLPFLLVKTPRRQRLCAYYLPRVFPECSRSSVSACRLPLVALREQSDVWSPSQTGNNLFDGQKHKRKTALYHHNKLSHGFMGSLYSQLYDFILAAIEWAQRDFRFRVSVTQSYHIILKPHTHPLFLSSAPYFLRSSKDHYSSWTWFLHIQGRRKKKTTQTFWIWCLLNQVP